jgi:hypothetical protein
MSNGSGVRHEEGAALAAAGQAKLTGCLSVVPAPPAPAATICSPASMKHAATTRPFWRFPATCRASCTAPTSSRRPSPIFFFRDVSLYTETISAPEQAPSVIHLRRERNMKTDPAGAWAMATTLDTAGWLISKENVMPTAATQSELTSDPLDRIRSMDQRLTEVIDCLRADIGRVEGPQFKAMFETAAEVLGGLIAAFRHYEERSERAWRRQ